MPDPAPPRSSLLTVGAGIAAFAVVIVVVLLQGGAGRGWGPQRPPSARHDLVLVAHAPDADAVALPAQPSLTIPQTEAGAIDQTTLDRLAVAPAEFAGRWFACVGTTDALPVWWPPQRSNPQAAPPGNTGKATGNASVSSDGHAMLARLGAVGAPLVADLVCEGAELRTWPVRVYFDPPALAALPAIGKGTVVALQLLGTDAAGNLQGRYLRVLDRPRLPVRRELPDWTAQWTGPLLAGAHPQLRCVADRPADLRDPSALDPATLALAATVVGAPPVAWFALACRDARGAAVPVLVHIPRELALSLLGVGPGSEVVLRLDRAGPDGMVASQAQVVAGAAEVPASDLRRILLNGEASVGRKVVCTSQGIPLPEVAQPEDPAVGPDKAPLADRKAWAVCAQPGAPTVHANLYLPGDHADRLLQVVRGSAIEARVLGVAGMRLHLLVERVAPPQGPIGAPVDPLDPPDLRRLVLLGSAIRDPDVRCRLTRQPLTGPRLMLPVAALRLGGEGAVALARLWCGDRVRPHVGQPIGVVGPGAAAQTVASLGLGSVARLRFVGVVENQPVAVWVESVAAEAVGAAGAVTP